MESLDHTPTGYAHHPCRLSPAKSTNSIDQLAHLHSKRDSAYSSFSTSSSIPEYPAFYKERSYSMENVHSRGRSQEGGMRQADIRYIKTVYNAQRGVSEEYEVKSPALLAGCESQARGYGANRLFGYNRGPQTRSSSDSENPYAKGAPMPPTRSDSYAAIRHHERPSSWSSLEPRKSCRTLSKSAWPHPGQGPSPHLQKPAFLEGQLHTVMEKSPESSPTLKAKQVYSQPGQPLLPTGVYPVPSPEPHFAQAPPPSASNSGMLYPALAKESGYAPSPASSPDSYEKVAACGQHSGLDENGNQSIPYKTAIFYQPEKVPPAAGKKETEDPAAKFILYRTHPQAYAPSPRQGESGPAYAALPVVQDVARNAQHLNRSSHLRLSYPRDVSNGNAHCQSKEHLAGEHQEDRNANLQRGDRDSAEHIQWGSAKTKQYSFSSLQNIPESTKLQNSLDLQEMHLCKNYPGSKRHFMNSTSQAEKDSQGHISERWQDREWKALEGHPDGVAGLEHAPATEPKLREPQTSPLPPKTSDFILRRLSSSSTQSFQNSPHGKLDSRKARCSVLEKVSKIEQREQGSQRPQSLSAGSFGQDYGSGRPCLSVTEDVRNRRDSQEHGQALGERCRLASANHSESPAYVQPAGERGVGQPERAHWHPAGTAATTAVQQSVYPGWPPENEPQKPAAQLQRSRSAFQLIEEPEKEALWKSNGQDLNGAQLDTPFNRAYRNSIKDAQSRVLRATSFSRRDLNISPPSEKEPKRSGQRPASAHVGMRSAAASPHTPKERHSITPTETNLNYLNQESLSGRLHVPRVRGRKRLTAEQKKRSYSEPEKMNEVGVSDSELSPFSLQKNVLHFVFPENSVADRRKIFERDNKACSTINLSKPELKQLQQTALADYIERKTGKRPSALQDTGFLQEGSQAPYLPSSGPSDHSLSSASSMISLQDPSLCHRRESLEQVSRKGRGFATLPPGLTGCSDLSGFENQKAHPNISSSSSAFPGWLKTDRNPDSRANPELTKSTQTEQFDMCTQPCHSHQDLGKKPAPSRKPGKSASTDDLLDRSDNQAIAVHIRSRSSPIADKMCQVRSGCGTSWIISLPHTWIKSLLC